jgi:hypothetical protein
MRLHAWSTEWRDVEFDPGTGSAAVIKLPAPRPDVAVPTGVAHFERSLLGPRQVFALFRSGDALFFSAGARRWHLGRPGLSFVHSFVAEYAQSSEWQASVRERWASGPAI